jgi:hypothetical protein
MDIEKELKEKEAAIAASGKLVPPAMVGASVGPKEPPGPKGPVGPKIRGPEDVVAHSGLSGKADVTAKPRVAQLDPRMVLQVELLATKKKLAEADERMGLWAVQDARRRKQDLDREEASMMAEVSRQLGAPAGSSIRLIDKERGLCQVE